MSTQQSTSNDGRNTSIVVEVADKGGVHAVVAGAWIGLYRAPGAYKAKTFDPNVLPVDFTLVAEQPTGRHGSTRFEGLEPHDYAVAYLHFPRTAMKFVTAHEGCTERVCLEPDVNVSVNTVVQSNDCKPLNCRAAQQGDNAVSTITFAKDSNLTIIAPLGSVRLPGATTTSAEFSTPLSNVGHANLSFLIQLPRLAGAGLASRDATAASQDSIGPNAPAELSLRNVLDVKETPPIPVSGNLGVALTRTETEVTEDLPLWVAIRNGTEALSFNNYLRYIDLLFCADNRNGANGGFHDERKLFKTLKGKRFLPFTDSDAYRVLKAATEAFVMVNCAVLDSPDAFHPRADNGYLNRRDLPAIQHLRAAFDDYLEPTGDGRVLPYLALVRRKLPDIPITDFDDDEANLCVGFVQDKLVSPCLVELIWSYWHEEAMLVQTMNAVTRRFQNVRSTATPDPLANLEIDPLRPLNNLIWGYTQDEQHRLTVNRRNYEYDHHYGLRLHGRAVQPFRPADTRSQFLEAFHHLLRLCTVFYKQDDDTTVKADAFPVLNALKEVHLVMSQGAHNQFGDMPSTARIEMLMQQWLLGRPEFREFLPTRIMVAYPEPWMDRVDAMKKLQGWTDTSVVHFRNLAIFGEQLLLTIRYGAWSEVYEPTQAFNWARFWRPQIQGYTHAYRAATGIDMSAETSDATADATLPSLLLQKRLAVQQRSA
jgi:hypothetical protein